MIDFDRWLKQAKIVEDEQDKLPEHVWDRDGKYFATCKRCERDYELGYDPEEFNEDTNYCGRNPWCLP